MVASSRSNVARAFALSTVARGLSAFTSVDTIIAVSVSHSGNLVRTFVGDLQRASHGAIEAAFAQAEQR